MILKIFLLVFTCNVVKCNPADLDTVLNNVGVDIKYELPPLAVPFIDRPQLESIKNYHTNSQKFVVLTGPRGIGKSALSRKYAENHIGSVLWMNSSTITQMVNDFKTLHTTNIGPIDNKKITAIIRSVFEHFKTKNTLYIFDAAKSDNVLLKQIKNYITDDDPSKVLVTSRDTNWDAFFASIPIDVFTKDDAVNFIKIVLRGLPISLDDTKCEEFAKALAYLPLALKKSTDFIIKQNGVRTYTIDDFLYELKHGTLPTTPMPYVIEEDPGVNWVAQLAEETDNIGVQINQGAAEAWETVSSGVNHASSQISHGAHQAVQEIHRAADNVGSAVRRTFSGWG